MLVILRSHCRGSGSSIFLLLLISVLASTSNSQTRPRASEPDPLATIVVSTQLVVLPVSVTDRKGEFVPGLGQEHFRVYEDGRLQQVTLFVPEDTPVTVGLVVDHSGSMRRKLPEVSAAVSAFAQSSKPQDEMFVVDFNDQVSIEVGGGHPFTSDPKDLQRALAEVSARGETALYDAILVGLNHLELGHTGKKALIVISDGGDNASHHKYSQMLAVARQSEAVIYSIVLIGDSSEEENPRLLERLCRDTGGIAFFPRTGEPIVDISTRIARDLREQYTLGYVPLKKINDGSFRRIQVQVTAPGRGKLHVRTRSGYSAVSEKHSSAEGGGEGS